MTGILAIETGTEACSIALSVDGDLKECHEIVPRQHNRRLFQLLDKLLAGRDLKSAGVTHLAYGSGPGSFTGLRIAASAAQGLAFACDLPVAPISSLAVVAQTALAQNLVQEHQTLLSTIDARVDELYAAVYRFEKGLAELVQGPWVSSPADLPGRADACTAIVGSGCKYVHNLPSVWRDGVLNNVIENVLPRASSLAVLAEAAIRRGEIQSALQVQPVYVQEEVGWKKLPEQGSSR